MARVDTCLVSIAAMLSWLTLGACGLARARGSRGRNRQIGVVHVTGSGKAMSTWAQICCCLLQSCLC